MREEGLFGIEGRDGEMSSDSPDGSQYKSFKKDEISIGSYSLTSFMM